MTLIDKGQIKNNFSRGALTYDRYAKVQKKMALGLLERIKSTGKDFKNILEIGCGTGFLTGQLIKNYPGALITAIDLSPQMIDVAKKNLGFQSNLTFQVGDGENLSLDGPFDLIVSSAVFQWFHSYLQSFTIYNRILMDDGLFIFNTLGHKTFKELHECFRFLRMDSPKHEYITAAELEKVLEKSGFANWTVDEKIMKDYYPSTRELLISIKKIGAQIRSSNVNELNQKAGQIFQLINHYDHNYRLNNKVYASYQVLYGFSNKKRGCRKTTF